MTDEGSIISGLRGTQDVDCCRRDCGSDGGLLFRWNAKNGPLEQRSETTASHSIVRRGGAQRRYGRFNQDYQFSLRAGGLEFGRGSATNSSRSDGCRKNGGAGRV